MRNAGIAIAVLGLAASVGLLLAAGSSTPFFLLVLFIGWVGLPFAFLLAGNHYSDRRPAKLAQLTFYITILITVVSIALYTYFTAWPPATTPARPWLLIPAFSLLLILILPISAFLTRRRSSVN